MKNFQVTAPALLLLVFSVFASFIPSAEALSPYSTRAQDAREYGGIKGDFSDGMVGKRYYDWDTVKTSYSQCTWEVVKGNLPPGLKLSRFGWVGGSEALLEGTPTKAGSYNFTVLVTFSDKSSLTKTFNITILDNPYITGAEIVGSFAAGNVNKPYSSSITVSNATEPYEWMYEGDLPQGLIFKGMRSGKLTLSGVPRERGTFPISVSVKDKFSFAEPQEFTIVIK